MKKIIIKSIKYLFISIIGLHLLLFLWVFIIGVLLTSIDPPFHSFMIYRKVINGFELKPKKHIKLKKLPWYVKYMLIKLEDCNFNTHNGIDIEAMKHAAKLNKLNGRKGHGGSTITQQLARTVFLIPDKFIVRKYFEILISLELEAILTKDRILELYLNNVEWGKGIFGIETASYHYYRKSSAYLTRDQAARLLTILSSPIRYTPYNFGVRRVLNIRYNSMSEFNR